MWLWSWPGGALALLNGLLFLTHLLVAARAIIRPNRTPASRAAWVLVIMFLPVIGIIAYLLLGETSIGRRRVGRLKKAETATAAPMSADYRPKDIASPTAELFEFCKSINGFEPVAGNRIRLLGDPKIPPSEPTRNSDIAIESLIGDIDAARDHIHIGFYIWLDDHNGGKVADAVAAAAKRGVHCRVMVDALGSRAFVRGPRWRQLHEAGAQCVATLNDIPRLGHLAVGRIDLRNHRKLAVIDNKIAYCGSQNCADPAFRVAAKYAPWIDILLRCEGPVVRQAQYLFLCTWIAETGDALENLPVAAPEPQIFEPGCVAQMYGTGPTTQGNAMSDSFVCAIYAARKELLITTPYFAPDEAVLNALCAAPRRGVRTTIIFPKRNNSRLVGNTCYSCYPALLQSGVAIYEYPLGLLHTKSMTIDGRLALVGSANMDRRSMQLNFENNLVVADEAVTATVAERQQGYLSVSEQVKPELVQAWPTSRRLLQNATAMMAPLL